MILVSSSEVFAVGIDAAISAADVVLSPKASETKSNARVQAVIDKIDAIGTVEYTGESLSKIVVAEKAYDALKSDEKLKVTNYGTLKAARAAYDALAADHVDTSSYTVKDIGVLSSGINWFVYDNGVLEISGEGKVPPYSAGGAPWYSYASSINTILVRSSVTGIGAFAFYGCNNVTNITLPFVGASRTATGYSATFGCVCYFLLNKNPLEGRWVYDSYTQYVFEKDGNGCLEVDDVHYEYTYKINGNTLTLDFVENIVRDCKYTFSVEDSQLTLIGGENTDGGTYQLTRK